MNCYYTDVQSQGRLAVCSGRSEQRSTSDLAIGAGWLLVEMGGANERAPSLLYPANCLFSLTRIVPFCPLARGCRRCHLAFSGPAPPAHRRLPQSAPRFGFWHPCRRISYSIACTMAREPSWQCVTRLRQPSVFRETLLFSSWALQVSDKPGTTAPGSLPNSQQRTADSHHGKQPSANLADIDAFQSVNKRIA